MIWFRSIEARSHDLIPFSYRCRRRARLASAPSAGDGGTVKGPGHTLAWPVGANLQAAVPLMAISISPMASSPQTLCQGTIPKPSCSCL
jgi:hypothetical protein